MKKIAILGANEAITRLIRKAKDKGYETHVFSWSKEEIGASIADYFYEISTDQSEEILSKCIEIGVCGICSITSDFVVPTVNYVSSRMGLVGNSEETSILARNKYRMRQALFNAGVWTPDFYLVKDFRDVKSIALKFPVIVKPVDSWSSRGITRVNAVEGLKSAVEFAQKESLTGQAILESFVDGREFSAECICYKGEAHLISIIENLTTGYPSYVKYGHDFITDLPKDVVEKLIKVISLATKALKIENSVAHVEFRLTENNDIMIIEIGARAGGDCITTHLTPIGVGIDFIGMIIDLACGEELNLNFTSDNIKVRTRDIFDMETLQHYKKLVETNSSKLIDAYIKVDDLDKLDESSFDGRTNYGYYVEYY